VDISSKPLWLTQTASDLARHEGFREFAYPDPLSKLGKRYQGQKVGWGYQPGDMLLVKLGEKEADGAPWTYGYGFIGGVTPASRISVSQADRRLESEILIHVQILDKLVPKWKSMPMYVQTVLANLAFNMGNRLAQFKNTLKFINDGQFHLAAHNLEQSLWFKQVGVRGKELVARLQTGRIPKEYLVVNAPDFTNVISHSDTVSAKE
jgi:lysozyme